VQQKLSQLMPKARVYYLRQNKEIGEVAIESGGV
jgi:hypothetical protein